jgi:hypothetical protein
MRRIFTLLIIAFALFATSAQAQEAPHIDGADLLVDLAKHAGHQVIIKNVSVWGADNDGALGRAGGVTLKITTTGIDPETFRYMLKNCASPLDGCNVRLLLATPTGEKRAGWPLLGGRKDHRIAAVIIAARPSGRVTSARASNLVPPTPATVRGAFSLGNMDVLLLALSRTACERS